MQKLNNIFERKKPLVAAEVFLFFYNHLYTSHLKSIFWISQRFPFLLKIILTFHFLTLKNHKDPCNGITSYSDRRRTIISCTKANNSCLNLGCIASIFFCHFFVILLSNPLNISQIPFDQFSLFQNQIMYSTFRTSQHPPRLRQAYCLQIYTFLVFINHPDTLLSLS